MDKKVLELYIDYMIVSSGQITATLFSKILGGKYSHDQLRRFLSKDVYAKSEHWDYIKPIIRRYASEFDGILPIEVICCQGEVEIGIISNEKSLKIGLDYSQHCQN